MTRRVLVVCTANVCRSPSAERLLQRRLDGLVDFDDHDWAVRSAGTASIRVDIDRNTIAAARELGIDLSDHLPRPLTSAVLSQDGADLVLTMTREHLRAVIGIDPAAWPRTFTLKELVRRASIIAPAQPDEGLHGWLRRVAEGRRAADLMRPDPVDDVDDPFGGPRREHERMLAEVEALIDQLVRLGPWRAPAERDLGRIRDETMKDR